MARWAVLGLTALFLCHGVSASPMVVSPVKSKAGPRKLHGKFLHITDFHPDDHYKVHTSTEGSDACHKGVGPSGFYGAETSDCDSPISLVEATFDWVTEHLKDQIDFVVWTGDSARHDGDDEIPRSASEVLSTNRRLANHFVDVFSDNNNHLTVPVVPNFGNNDILPHNIMNAGPNQWLQHYLDIWRRFIPEEQRHSFEYGGWFYVDVIPNKLAVFSLNTLYFFDRNAAIDDCVHPNQPGTKQMEWLRVQLEFMRERGMKAILTGHVPPTHTESKRLWEETCWQKYTLWLKQYRDVVVGALFGHMNIDHFFLQDTHEIDLSLLTSWRGVDDSYHAMTEDEFSIQSKADYLEELREDWSRLNPPAALSEVNATAEAINQGVKHKKPKLHDPWCERYQLSLVSPSIVPNYFPTLRVFEYNISGLENNPVWRDTHVSKGQSGLVRNDEVRLELRDLYSQLPEMDDKSQLVLKTDDGFQDVGKKKKKNKKGKKKHEDPDFIVPDPPSKSSPPGPAYSPQTLTFTGYTQYFANLTHINNDLTPDDDVKDGELEASWLGRLLGWQAGKQRGRTPKSGVAKPRKFAFKVEYSTFDDKLYNLPDLTVKSFVKLAYKIGQDASGKQVSGLDGVDGDGYEDETLESPEDSQSNAKDDGGMDLDDDEDNDDVGSEGKKKKRHKKKHRGKKHHEDGDGNLTWIHFLRYAFVSTVEDAELAKLY